MAKSQKKSRKTFLRHFRADEALISALVEYAGRRGEAVAVVVREVLRERLRAEGLLEE